jgi:hypothetical protein
MPSSRRPRRAVGLALAAALIALPATAAPAAAHTRVQAGPYTIELGWLDEPTYVGRLNAAVIVVSGPGGEPVTDLFAGDLSLVAGFGGRESDPIEFEPAFSPIGGMPGEYRAPLLPTEAGEFSFRIVGTIDGTAIDVAVASGPTTFDSPIGTTALEFPVRLPTIGELTTRVERVDGRATGAASAAEQAQAASAAATGQVAELRAAADEARATATLAVLVGGGLGLLGAILGGLGLLVARRSTAVSGP